MSALSRVLTSRSPSSVYFPLLGLHQACAALHILALEASETVDFSRKFSLRVLWNVWLQLSSLSALLESHRVLLVTPNPGTVIV